MKPVLVKMCGYVLQLEEGKFYVGTTYNLNFRYSQHVAGQGAIWTRAYKPIGMISVAMDINQQDWENKMTLDMMRQHGIDNVRGGSWCKENINTERIKKLLFTNEDPEDFRVRDQSASTDGVYL